jgi:glycosyltransferase involved in cell wall biosynthesis
MSEADADSRMNILFVHENTGPSGGAETNIQITAEELKARGHRMALFYSSPKTGMPWQKVFPKTFSLEQPENPNSKIEDVLGEFEPDIIYIHKVRNLDLFEALLRTGIPTVRMVHDHEMYCLRQYKYNPLTRAICTRSASGFCVFPCLAPLARNRRGGFPIKWASYADRQREMQLSRDCDQLIVYSEFSKAELVRNGFDSEKIHLHIPIGCWGNSGPVSSFSDRNLILFAGQIIRGKGVDLLLKALSKITLPFECLILGDGSHRSHCEELCRKLRLQDRVKFAGYVPHDEMRQFYVEANVFAMPSVWPEPFGMAGPEAMRYGLPVVAFDAGGIREWLHDGLNGFLAPWMDADAFAARLQLLLKDKALARRLGQRGLENVNKVYESRAQVSRLEYLFCDVSNTGRFSAEHRSSPTAGKPCPAQSFKLSENKPAMNEGAVECARLNTI